MIFTFEQRDTFHLPMISSPAPLFLVNILFLLPNITQAIEKIRDGRCRYIETTNSYIPLSSFEFFRCIDISKFREQRISRNLQMAVIIIKIPSITDEYRTFALCWILFSFIIDLLSRCKRDGINEKLKEIDSFVAYSFSLRLREIMITR